MPDMTPEHSGDSDESDSIAEAMHRRLDPWLDTKHAADYLCMTVNALHKLTAARAIPFEQDGPGCKCWFKRSELDDWRRRGGSS